MFFVFKDVSNQLNQKRWFAPDRFDVAGTKIREKTNKLIFLASFLLNFLLNFFDQILAP
jgi:hypothetical protein